MCQGCWPLAGSFGTQIGRHQLCASLLLVSRCTGAAMQSVGHHLLQSCWPFGATGHEIWPPSPLPPQVLGESSHLLPLALWLSPHWALLQGLRPQACPDLPPSAVPSAWNAVPVDASRLASSPPSHLCSDVPPSRRPSLVILQKMAVLTLVLCAPRGLFTGLTTLFYILLIYSFISRARL